MTSHLAAAAPAAAATTTKDVVRSDSVVMHVHAAKRNDFMLIRRYAQ